MIQLQNGHSFQPSTDKENGLLTRRFSRIFEIFKSDPLEKLSFNLPTTQPTTEFEIDEDFTESVGVLYKDAFITLHEDHICIPYYEVPITRWKQIHYRDIAQVYNSQDLYNHQHKLWGSSGTGTWWGLDKRFKFYSTKYDTMILILQNSKRLGVSIKDSNQIGFVKRLVCEANETMVLIE
ncbi:hypothetical protein K7432_010681 [Basidiobolus ranarum]|uniref:Uncharacterized protein n=1 Tax=Basidiobolus ranarum TaxID=34480 RepID=A0ABR2VVJ9_9FUNG